MALNWQPLGVAPGEILLPREDVYLPAWAVVACDQFTSQPEYWQEAAMLVGDQPSTLHITLPEIYLSQARARLPGIVQTMGRYLKTGVLRPAVKKGFILTERSTGQGARVGLMALADMEAYDSVGGYQSLIRPTEETIASRVPPRMEIRGQAPLECPHVTLLMDDVMESVVEPVYARRDELPVLYDFDLQMGGGHLKGWAVEGESLLHGIHGALSALKARLPLNNPMLFAVGDGNHSLAAAKAHWEGVKERLGPAGAKGHPARYALVELENIHDDALSFQPIHRLITGAQGYEMMRDWTLYCHERGMDLSELPGENGEHVFRVKYGGNEVLAAVAGSPFPTAAGTLQVFLDEWLREHPKAAIDYIHGEDALDGLLEGRGDAVGFLTTGIEKGELIPKVMRFGPLPRKTFSLGEAREKRYYMECRRIL